MHQFQQTKKPELLAPAGSLEAFFAAMEKGADAVYAGLKEFSARAKAKNFSLPQMERMVAYAHAHGRKVYITLNTLVKEAELPRLVECLAALEGMGADGIIIQDLGVARLIRGHFPGLPRHASTQLTVHSRPGVQVLEELGFERVVLARELHIDDIASIVRASKAEIECFIHGALCFCISGQCFLSSFLGGHSGNRGRCAQPCRRQYRYKGKEGYYLSTNDFSSIDMVPQIMNAGIASLKIEGRMKSAEYVASVVEAYRRVLDAPERKRHEAVAEAKELLKLSFGRVPTKGFLASREPADIATPSLKGATGRFLGEIRAIRGNRISFETRDRLHVGDRIRVQPKSDMAGKAFTVKELFVGKDGVKAAREKSVVSTVSPFPFKVGDAVFKVSSETAFTMSENACLRKLDAAGPAKLPCDLVLELRYADSGVFDAKEKIPSPSTGEGQGGGDAGEDSRRHEVTLPPAISPQGRGSADAVLIVAARVAGGDYRFAFPLGELEPSRTADMTGVLTAQFGKTGDTPFILRSLAAPEFPALLIPPARLKELRRELYRQLAECALADVDRRRAAAMQRALAALVPSSPVRRFSRPELVVKLEHLRDATILHQPGVDAVILPVSRANLHQLLQAGRKLKGDATRVIWQLPFFFGDDEVPFHREAVATIANAGFRRFEAANIAHFAILKGHDLELSTDFRLFSLNSQALLVWHELGAAAATLYIEDDQENLAALLAANLPLQRRVVVYGGVPAMTTRIAIKGVKGDAPLVSDRGEEYDLRIREGLTTITPAVRFSLTAHRARLLEMGCCSFVADLTQTPPGEWRRVLDAITRGEALPGTSEFNFTAGLV